MFSQTLGLVIIFWGMLMLLIQWAVNWARIKLEALACLLWWGGSSDSRSDPQAVPCWSVSDLYLCCPTLSLRMSRFTHRIKNYFLWHSPSWDVPLPLWLPSALFPGFSDSKSKVSLQVLAACAAVTTSQLCMRSCQKKKRKQRNSPKQSLL